MLGYSDSPVRILFTFLPHLSGSVSLPRPVYTERSTMRSARRFIASVLSGGLLAVSGLACHSSSPATTTLRQPRDGPTVMLSPATLTFSNVGTAQTVTVTNSGSAALAITSIVASVNFTETDNCVGQSVAVGATCTINVSFVVAAASSGGSSGSVTITDNAADSPESLSLGGPQISQPGAVLLPMSIGFWSAADRDVQQCPDSHADKSTQRQRSCGAADHCQGDDERRLHTCRMGVPAPLSHGNGCSFSVTFTPTTSGTRTGTLNVFDNSPAAGSISRSPAQRHRSIVHGATTR